MENQNVKRGPGRPKKYSTEEEKKEAIKQQKLKYKENQKLKYMQNQKIKRGPGRPKKIKYLDDEWFCNICKDKINYSLSGKSEHLETKKHKETADAKAYIEYLFRSWK